MEQVGIGFELPTETLEVAPLHLSWGRRPSFIQTAPPELGKTLYDEFVRAVADIGVRVEKGVFQTQMTVELVNEGPVTILLDSDQLF